MTLLRKRYNIVPQMKEYDNLPVINVPFLMHAVDYYTSSRINVSNGLRESSGSNLVVGGSFAFGVGATKDAYTVPNRMGWRNFGGRAYTSTQELLLYLFYSNRSVLKKQPEKIIILSGLNDLVVPKLISNYPIETGGYFFWDKYKTSNFDMKNTFIPIERTLKIWKDLSVARGFKIIFVLQPFFNWTDKQKSPEEEKLFGILDRFKQKHWKLIRDLDVTTYEWYSDWYKDVVKSCEFPFYDMNEILRNKYHNEWLWVDRAHMTDRGYEIVAKECGLLSFL